ncbi:pectin acetylesterase 7-like isoform X1 [Salvia divinorum]
MSEDSEYNDPCYQQLRTIPDCFYAVLDGFCYASDRHISIDCCKIYASLDSGCIHRFAEEATARRFCYIYDDYVSRQADILLRFCKSKI